MYKPAHSEFLIHWTGNDIDHEHDSGWSNRTSSETSDDVTRRYLERLRNILRHGLWMREDEPEELRLNGRPVARPTVARISFTELKLSESRDHAQKFGRLGIGVKRYFLLNRLGQPLIYVQEDTQTLFLPPFSHLFAGGLSVQLLSFFKHMSSPWKAEESPTYDLLDESEWRIIYSPEVRGALIGNGLSRVADLFVDPLAEGALPELSAFYEQLKGPKRPRYLLPLDPWLAMIIYPSLRVKMEAERDPEIRRLLKLIKQKALGGCPETERESEPIELDLDACRSF